MHIQFLINHFMKCFKYAVAAAVLFLVTITANANDVPFLHSYTIKKGISLYRHQDQPRMFLIAVADTHDETIGERCKADLDGVTDEFEYVAKVIDAEWINPKIIEGAEFSKASVNDAIDNWLKNQQLTADDIVIFYYSGHGFRDSTDTSNYPRMWLKTDADRNVENNNLRIEEDIYDHIIKMGAGVNIVLSDCCNSTNAGANTNFDNVTVPDHKRDHDNENKTDNNKNGHELFIPGQPLSILVAAASKGELAGGKTDDGGFFTAFFLDALDDEIDDDSKEATWENIFKYADKNASYWAKSAACPEYKHNEEGRCMQTAEIKINDSN